MPIGFPSHQGLLAPLWRRWPQRFSVLALWAGALAPDVVDGIVNMVRRGTLGQAMAHSLLGCLVLDVPAGLALTWLVRAVARARSGAVARWIVRHDDAPQASRLVARWLFEARSALVGAISHVLFDLVSHEEAQLLSPFGTDPQWLGAWWSQAWLRVSFPGYPSYGIGPHFVGWLVLSALGAWLFFRYPPRSHHGTPSGSRCAHASHGEAQTSGSEAIFPHGGANAAPTPPACVMLSACRARESSVAGRSSAPSRARP